MAIWTPEMNKNGMKKRDENRNPIYPGWWPDDHVTEATNRARGMPKPKAKQRVGPRLSYSLKGANENENILTNDLVTEAYIDVPSSGYRAGYKPLKGTKRSQIVQKQKEEFASKRAMDISTKPFTVKERVLMNRRSNSSGNNNQHRIVQIDFIRTLLLELSGGDLVWAYTGRYGSTVKGYGTGAGTVNKPLSIDTDYQGNLYYTQQGDYFPVLFHI